MPLTWIAGRLARGSRGYLAYLLSRRNPSARHIHMIRTAFNMTISLTAIQTVGRQNSAGAAFPRTDERSLVRLMPAGVEYCARPAATVVVEVAEPSLV